MKKNLMVCDEQRPVDNAGGALTNPRQAAASQTSFESLGPQQSPICERLLASLPQVVVVLRQLQHSMTVACGNSAGQQGRTVTQDLPARIA